jgi:hypothetical protein
MTGMPASIASSAQAASCCRLRPSPHGGLGRAVLVRFALVTCSAVNARLQPRRHRIAPAAVGCK